MRLEGQRQSGDLDGAQNNLVNDARRKELINKFKNVLIPPIYIWDGNSAKEIKLEKRGAPKDDWYTMPDFLKAVEKDLVSYGGQSREILFRRVITGLESWLNRTQRLGALSDKSKRFLSLKPEEDLLVLYVKENRGLEKVDFQQYKERFNSRKTKRANLGKLQEGLKEKPSPSPESTKIEPNPFGSLAGGLSASVSSAQRRRAKLHTPAFMNGRRASSGALRYRTLNKLAPVKSSRRLPNQRPLSPLSERTLNDHKIYNHFVQGFMTGMSQGIHTAESHESIMFYLQRLFVPRSLNGFLELFSDEKLKETVNYELALNSSSYSYLKLMSFIRKAKVNDIALQNIPIDNLLASVGGSHSKLKHLLIPLGAKLKSYYLYHQGLERGNPSILNMITDLAFNPAQFAEIARQIAGAFLYVLALDISNQNKKAG